MITGLNAIRQAILANQAIVAIVPAANIVLGRTIGDEEDLIENPLPALMIVSEGGVNDSPGAGRGRKATIRENISIVALAKTYVDVISIVEIVATSLQLSRLDDGDGGIVEVFFKDFGGDNEIEIEEIATGYSRAVNFLVKYQQPIAA